MCLATTTTAKGDDGRHRKEPTTNHSKNNKPGPGSPPPPAAAFVPPSGEDASPCVRAAVGCVFRNADLVQRVLQFVFRSEWGRHDGLGLFLMCRRVCGGFRDQLRCGSAFGGLWDGVDRSTFGANHRRIPSMSHIPLDPVAKARYVREQVARPHLSPAQTLTLRLFMEGLTHWDKPHPTQPTSRTLRYEPIVTPSEASSCTTNGFGLFIQQVNTVGRGRWMLLHLCVQGRLVSGGGGDDAEDDGFVYSQDDDSARDALQYVAELNPVAYAVFPARPIEAYEAALAQGCPLQTDPSTGEEYVELPVPVLRTRVEVTARLRELEPELGVVNMQRSYDAREMVWVKSVGLNMQPNFRMSLCRCIVPPGYVRIQCENFVSLNSRMVLCQCIATGDNHLPRVSDRMMCGSLFVVDVVDGVCLYEIPTGPCGMSADFLNVLPGEFWVWNAARSAFEYYGFRPHDRSRAGGTGDVRSFGPAVARRLLNGDIEGAARHIAPLPLWKMRFYRYDWYTAINYLLRCDRFMPHETDGPLIDFLKATPELHTMETLMACIGREGFLAQVVEICKEGVHRQALANPDMMDEWAERVLMRYVCHSSMSTPRSRRGLEALLRLMLGTPRDPGVYRRGVRAGHSLAEFRTLLDHCVQMPGCELVEVLVAHGLDLSAYSGRLRAPFEPILFRWARDVVFGGVDTIALFVRRGYDINEPNKAGHPLLHLLAQNEMGQHVVLRLLQKLDGEYVDFELRCPYGYTLTQCMARRESVAAEFNLFMTTLRARRALEGRPLHPHIATIAPASAALLPPMTIGTTGLLSPEASLHSFSSDVGGEEEDEDEDDDEEEEEEGPGGGEDNVDDDDEGGEGAVTGPMSPVF